MNHMLNACPVETTLSMINGKWKLSIFKTLSHGAIRFGRLADEIPAVSSKVLTQQLRELEADGLIARTVYPEVPPHVEYSLTEKGRSLFIIFVEMRRWALEEDELHQATCINCRKCVPYSPDAERILTV